MCVSLGYFTPIVGFNLYIVTLDDVTLTIFSLLFLFSIVLLGIQYADEVLKFTGWTKVVSIISLVFIVFVQKGYFAYQAYQTEKWASAYNFSLTIILSTLAILAFLFYRKRIKSSDYTLDLNTATTLVGIPAILCYIFGLQQFYSDFASAYPIKITRSEGIVEGLFLTERSNYIVLLDVGSCQYTILEKNTVTSRSIDVRQKDIRDNRNRCLHS